MEATVTDGASAGASYQIQIICGESGYHTRNGGDSGGDPLEDFTADGNGFDFGQAFDLRVELGLFSSSSGDYNSGSSASATDVELTLTGIKISETEEGDAIAASIVSGSNTSYPVIPEPASIALIGMAASKNRRCRS